MYEGCTLKEVNEHVIKRYVTIEPHKVKITHEADVDVKAEDMLKIADIQRKAGCIVAIQNGIDNEVEFLLGGDNPPEFVLEKSRIICFKPEKDDNFQKLLFPDN